MFWLYSFAAVGFVSIVLWLIDCVFTAYERAQNENQEKCQHQLDREEYLQLSKNDDWKANASESRGGLAIDTSSGRAPDPNLIDSPAPQPINPATGQHKDYWVLAESERCRGFVRPVRQTYIHKTCGMLTSMGIEIAETYARKPTFYSRTFCCTCKDHFPVGEFTWAADGSVVGS